MARRLRRAAAALAVAVLLGACGVPTQSDPTRIDDRDVPFGLLRKPKPKATTTTTTTTVPR
jgi:hypothetical protein